MSRSHSALAERRPAGPLAVFSACLLISGAAALIYEILWFRHLSLVMGHTAYALSAMLTAFLGGLALGAFLGGWWTRRGGASARLYAWLELIIGGFGLVIPWSIRAVDPLFTLAYSRFGDWLWAYSAIQFAVAAGIFLLPTVCMGATLPVAVAATIRQRRRDISVDSGRLYAFNSFGGVLGVVLAGLVLLPSLGMQLTGLVAVLLNLVAAAGAFWVSRVWPESAEVAVAPPARPSKLAAGQGTAAADWIAPGPALMMCCYGVSGFAALTLEVAWSRLVSLVIGSTIYGLTMILATYIAGLAAGSFLVPRIGLAARHPVQAVFVLHILIALWTVFSLPFLGELPVRVAQIMAGGNLSFHALLAAQALLVLSSIAVPTVAMGGLFPLVAQLVYRNRPASGHAVGSTYAANTLGNILGSLAAGFVLIPAVGTRGTILLAAALSAGVGLCYLAPSLLARRRDAVLAAVLTTAGIAIALAVAPSWRQARLTSAPFMLGAMLRQAGADREAAAAAIERSVGELLEYRDGVAGSVSVTRHGKALHLRIDGVREAGVGEQPGSNHVLGHLPMLLHGEAKKVLVIGLGSGATLSSVLTYPVTHVDSIEISADVVDVVRRYFAAVTGNPLDDPRVRQIVGDGRNFLRHTDGRYDVIISQPSHPWQSGAASLFTREYFAEMRDHLAVGGIAAAWFWSYNEDAQRAVMKAWREVFESSYVFEYDLNTILVGRREAGPLSAARVAAAMVAPAASGELAQLRIREPADVFALLQIGPDAMVRYAGDAPINSDDNAFVELHGLRGFETGRAVSRKAFQPFRERPLALVDLQGLQPAERAAFEQRLATLREIETLTDRAAAILAQEGRSPAWKAMQDLVALLSKHQRSSGGETAAGVTDTDIAMAYSNVAAALAGSGKTEDAIEEYKKAIERAPRLAELHYNLGATYHHLGRLDEAHAEYARAIELSPGLAAAHYNLGVVHFQQQRFDLAVAHIDQALAIGYPVPPQTLERLRPYRR